MRLLKLTHIGGSQVWVNVDQITTISTTQNAFDKSETTFIDFAHPDLRISVKQSADQIISLLGQGGNDIR
jgi:hypothetical protein